jgi:MFS family permease
VQLSLRSLQATATSALFGRAHDVEGRNLRNIICSGFFVGFIDGGIYTYLPVYLARLGASPGIMGLLSAGPQLISMLLYVPSGALVERQSNLVRLVNLTVMMHRSGYLLLAALPFFLAAPQIPLTAALIWSAIYATVSFSWPAILVVIQRAVSPSLCPRAMGGRWAAMTVVAAVLIPLLGYALDHAPSPAGYQLVFVLSFVGSLPNMYFFSRVHVPPNLHRILSDDQRPTSERLREYLHPFIKNRLFMRYNVATAVFRICLSMPAGLYSLYWVDSLKATDTWIGLRGMVGFGVLALGYGVWGRIAHRIGHRRVLFIAGATLGVYPILTGMAHSAAWLLPAAAVWGVGMAGIDIGLVDMLLLSAPEDRKPSFVAVGNMLACAENSTGPLLGAALATIIGLTNALLLSGILAVASVGLFLFLPSREQEYAIHATQRQPAV